MPHHDVKCATCGKVETNYYLADWPDRVMHMKGKRTCGEYVIQWSLGTSHQASVNERERAVVWAHPVHGIRYPGRNDAPMPEAYRKAGFERKELTSYSELQRFCKAKGIANEHAEFDRGTGHDFMGN